MALKQPSPIGFFQAVYLCVLALMAPKHFDKIEKQDSLTLETGPNATSPTRIAKVRSALIGSLYLVVASSLVGIVVGYLAHKLFGRSDKAIAILQIVGAGTLLWATIAVRGWDIQTFGGATLTERVNQWLYRFLYCFGTSILVLTVAWQAMT